MKTKIHVFNGLFCFHLIVYFWAFGYLILKSEKSGFGLRNPHTYINRLTWIISSSLISQITTKYGK